MTDVSVGCVQTVPVNHVTNGVLTFRGQPTESTEPTAQSTAAQTDRAVLRVTKKAAFCMPLHDVSCCLAQVMGSKYRAVARVNRDCIVDLLKLN